jgi:hypothetical protein
MPDNNLSDSAFAPVGKRLVTENNAPLRGHVGAHDRLNRMTDFFRQHQGWRAR